MKTVFCFFAVSSLFLNLAQASDSILSSCEKLRVDLKLVDDAVTGSERWGVEQTTTVDQRREALEAACKKYKANPSQTGSGVDDVKKATKDAGDALAHFHKTTSDLRAILLKTSRGLKSLGSSRCSDDLSMQYMHVGETERAEQSAVAAACK